MKRKTLLLTERMTTVLVIAQVLALGTVIRLVSLPLLFIQLESTTSALLLL